MAKFKIGDRVKLHHGSSKGKAGTITKVIPTPTEAHTTYYVVTFNGGFRKPLAEKFLALANEVTEDKPLTKKEKENKNIWDDAAE